MLTLFLLNMLMAQAEAPDAPRSQNYSLSADLSYFTTTSNYPAGGFATEDLPNSGSFTDIIGRLQYTQDLDSTRRFYGGLTYSSVESYDGTFTRSNSGLNEILAGGQYWMRMGGYKFAPSVDFVYPLFRVDRGADEALLGEGALKVRAGSWMFLRYGGLSPFLYVAYEYRDEGRSHAIPYALGAKWTSRPFFVQLDYSGYEKLFNNADTENRSSRDVFLRRVNGGSYRYYSINPALSEVAATVGYTIQSVTLVGGASYTVNGSTAAQGLTVFGGFRFSPAGVKPELHTEEDEEESFAPIEPEIDTNFDELDPTKRPPKRRVKPVAPAAKPAPRPAAPVSAPVKPEPVVQPAPEVKLVPAPKASPQPSATPSATPSAKPAVKPAPKAAPKPKPRPAAPKKDKVDKLLDQTEQRLKEL